MTTDTAVLPTTPSTKPSGFRQRGRLAQLGADSAYNLLRFPIAIAAFVAVVTGLSVGAGLLVIWVGVAVLSVALLVMRGFAMLERAMIPAVLGYDVPQAVYRQPEGSRLRRMLTPLRDPQTWLDSLHGFVAFPFAILGFVVTVTWWSVTIGGLTYGAYDWALPDPGTDPDNTDLFELLGFQSTPTLRITAYALVGLLFAITLPFVVRGTALLQAQIARGLLTSRATAQAEIGRLAGSRDAAVAAEAEQLRRLERDIHDGPQQRLVRLQMDLARAQRQMERDPEAARTTLGDAAGLARETLEELRALSRGIAPPVLADRGLAAALAAISARSPVPVELDVEGLPTERLAPVTENTAYFVVSEALANAAKHSDATTVRVSVARYGGLLRVEVEDDGSGGAVLAPGHGLAGLSDRLRAVDGALTVDSPRGGPTRLIAEVPCA
ncbi:sensor histidine kinase [Petropleomorpha daqingensis]|uniref:histidine kinase n=1 Tax=Petropleomorpha daqingensis TaxID=2026353 RepID=A0A853CHP8_9ACTN|nr:sensor domain-containing protein [Petropleomorpha daqingensis]NYJ07007.1 signal transduction histidine kinase [Petropleomorpha daqingensis]